MAANTAAINIIVKITNGTEIRRFTTQSHNLTWTSLAKQACDLFELKNKALKLTYVDDEGDRITLSSNAELDEAKELALKNSPAILRLTIITAGETNKNDKESSADVPMADAATGAPEANQPFTQGAADMNPFFQNLAQQLPALVDQLPPGVRRLIPHAELDVAATLAANAAANAPCAAAAAAAAAMQAAEAAAHTASAAAEAAGKTKTSSNADAPVGVHVGVTCDRSGMSPIVGDRYHLVGHNYDLCEAEFAKLNDKEKALYQRIPPPFVHLMPTANGVGPSAVAGIHPGVECDRSGQNPIVGMRYHLRGHNYDLCQSEFDKLSAADKALYTPIHPPVPLDGGGGGTGGNGPWRGGGRWGCGGRWGGGGGGGGGGCRWGANAAENYPKLAARFVRDVTIFDGTQMAPSTSFTKIWRLKNTGEVPWPAGSKMLFVGGDQMTSELMVPISRATPVLPGEEVDVAVEMVAPTDLGRYLGYWRLVGPHGRRKFGQRVWCHVQVVDPSAGPPSLNEADLAAESEKIQAEIANKSSGLDDDAEDGTDDNTTDDGAGSAPWTAAPTSTEEAPDVSDATVPVAPSDGSVVPTSLPTSLVAEDTAERSSDDGFVVCEAEAVEAAAELDNKKAAPAAAASTSGGGSMGVDDVTRELASMGFTDKALVAIVLEKHGADLSACARDLAAATEWESTLDDLAEMGFANRELNKTLLLKHSGNVKRTVRELVEDA